MRYIVVFMVLVFLIAACSTNSTPSPAVATQTKVHAPKPNSKPTTQKQFELLKSALDNYDGNRASLKKVKSTIEQIIGEQPNFAPVYTQLARYLLFSGRISRSRYQAGTLQAADKALKKSLKIDPNFADAYITYGWLYRLMKKTKQARNALEKAQKLGSTNPYLHIHMADVLLSVGKKTEAARHYELLLKSKLNNTNILSEAMEGLIRHYRSVGKVGKVSKLYARLIELKPMDSSLYTNYASHMLYYVGDFEAAIKFARQAQQKLDNESSRYILAASLYRKWAYYYLELKNNKGQKYFNEAKKLYPKTDKIARDAARSSHTRITLKAFRSKDLEAMNRALQRNKP